jgi:hypothetical protein
MLNIGDATMSTQKDVAAARAKVAGALNLIDNPNESDNWKRLAENFKAAALAYAKVVADLRGPVVPPPPDTKRSGGSF